MLLIMVIFTPELRTAGQLCGISQLVEQKMKSRESNFRNYYCVCACVQIQELNTHLIADHNEISNRKQAEIESHLML